ncbi:peptidoglycan-binding protein, partial [Oryzihumus sp.]
MSDQPFALYRLGDEGAGVRDIRERLLATGDLRDDAGIDVYDESVRTAVRSFQQRRGLIADGVVGPHTWVALDGARWRLGDRVLSHTPGHMLQGDDVSELQQRVLALGFSPGRVDGVFGPDTEHAVRQFQRGVGLPADGTVGPETLRAFADLSRS